MTRTSTWGAAPARFSFFSRRKKAPAQAAMQAPPRPYLPVAPWPGLIRLISASGTQRTTIRPA
jgi:hypothetical protein